MRLRRKSREQRLVESILKRIERDVNPITPFSTDDKWRIVACDMRSDISGGYGVSQSMSIELRRIR